MHLVENILAPNTNMERSKDMAIQTYFNISGENLDSKKIQRRHNCNLFLWLDVVYDLMWFMRGLNLLQHLEENASV